MMEPEFRFCTSADGTQLAYATLGDGAPLLHVPGFSTNVEVEWQDAECRAWMEQVAASRLLVRCQRRGVGASQRDMSDLSLKAQAQDLAAVVNHARLKELDIFAAYDGVPSAVMYALAHPDQVSRLVLWAGSIRGTDVSTPQAYNALADLAVQNWRVFLRTWADLCFPSGPPERQRWYLDLVRHSLTPETAAAYVLMMRDVDLTDSLQYLAKPTLVMHREADRYVPPAFGRALAAALPDARFVLLHGDVGLPVVGDRSYLKSMMDFLERRTPRAARAPQGTAIILFADIVDSTALTERMGDAAFRERARALDVSLRDIISGAGGTAIDGKLLGDGVLATFPAASQAIDAALRCAAAGDEQALPLHLGLHAGDVIREQNNVFGGAVNIASRISGLSAPGEVLVSDVVRALARTSAAVTFEDRGEHALKGVADPQRVYAVRKDGA